MQYLMFRWLGWKHMEITMSYKWLIVQKRCQTTWMRGRNNTCLEYQTHYLEIESTYYTKGITKYYPYEVSREASVWIHCLLTSRVSILSLSTVLNQTQCYLHLCTLVMGYFVWFSRFHYALRVDVLSLLFLRKA